MSMLCLYVVFHMESIYAIPVHICIYGEKDMYIHVCFSPFDILIKYWLHGVDHLKIQYNLVLCPEIYLYTF